jgi:hypothetical protein
MDGDVQKRMANERERRSSDVRPPKWPVRLSRQTGKISSEASAVWRRLIQSRLCGTQHGEATAVTRCFLTLPWRGRVGSHERSECETGWGDGLSTRALFKARDCHPTPPLLSVASTLPLEGRVSEIVAQFPILFSKSVSPRSRRVFSREVCLRTSCPRKRGRRECRALDAPAAWRAEKTATPVVVVTTVTPEITRHSPRNGFTVSFVLSPATGLSCHRRPRFLART